MNHKNKNKLNDICSPSTSTIMEKGFEKVWVLSLNIKYIFLLVLLISSHATSKSVAKTFTQKQPDIWLSAYQTSDSIYKVTAEKNFRLRSQFQNEFISKNGSDYVSYDDSIYMEFSCEADYSIIWNFPRPEQIHPIVIYSNIDVEDSRISSFSSNDAEPVNVRFRSVFIISSYTVKFLSVNVTCSSVDKQPELSSSIHIYVQGQDVMEHKGETLNIHVERIQKKKSASPVVLPCLPATPNLQVSLEKKKSILNVGDSTSENTKWERVILPESYMSFDPKTGFTVQRSILGDGVLGFYRCTVVETLEDGTEEVHNDDYVYMNVTVINTTNPEDENKDVPSFEPRSNIHGKASVHLGYLSEETDLDVYFTCYTGMTDKPPKLYSLSCGNPLQCELSKKVMLEMVATGKLGITYGGLDLVNSSSDCRKEMAIDHGMLLVCQGENVDFMDYFIEKFHPLAGGPVTNRSSRIRQANLSNDLAIKDGGIKDVSLSLYESITKPVVINETMLMTVGRRLLDDEPTPVNNGPFIYFHTDTEETDDDGLTIAGITISMTRTEFTTEYDRDFYYENEPLTFMCIGLKYFYADGAHVRLNWANGTKTVVEKKAMIDANLTSATKVVNHYVSFSGKADLLYGNAADAMTRFGTPLLARPGMTSVDCWMPKVRSNKWDKISKSLTILPSVAPAFLEKEEETMYLYVGDKDGVLTCTVDEGLPAATVKVTRDGREIEFDSDVEAENEPNNDTMSQAKTLEDKKHLMEVRIHLPVIEHDLQSVYRCTAKNVNRTVTRTITVFVIEKPGVAVPITLCIVGLLMLVFIGLGVKHWRDKRSGRCLQ